MEQAGQKLKRVRERLKLRYRDVEQASQQIAQRRGHPEYTIALSRLSDIENKGMVPTIYRLYTLCAIYRLDLNEVLSWYEVYPDQVGADAASLSLGATHLVQFQVEGRSGAAMHSDRDMPDTDSDAARTAFLGHVRRWGKLSAGMLQGFDPKYHRLGYIGLDDRSMYPLLHPGSVVIIDERQRRIAGAGWNTEFERPIYFFESRDSYLCGWCTLTDSQLVFQPHPSSACRPAVFRYPNEIEVVGRVVGVAMLMDSQNQRGLRAVAARAGSPGR